MSVSENVASAVTMLGAPGTLAAGHVPYRCPRSVLKERVAPRFLIARESTE